MALKLLGLDEITLPVTKLIEKRLKTLKARDRRQLAAYKERGNERSHYGVGNQGKFHIKYAI